MFFFSSSLDVYGKWQNPNQLQTQFLSNCVYEVGQVSHFKCTPLKMNSFVNLQQPIVLQSDSPSHCIMAPQLATAALHCKVTPNYGMTPNKQ